MRPLNAFLSQNYVQCTMCNVQKMKSTFLFQNYVQCVMYKVQCAENEERLFVSELSATAVDLRVLEVKKEETAAESRFDLPRAQLLICQEPNFPRSGVAPT